LASNNQHIDKPDDAILLAIVHNFLTNEDLNLTKDNQLKKLLKVKISIQEITTKRRPI